MKSIWCSSSYVPVIILFSQTIVNIRADPLVTHQVYFDVGTKNQNFGRIVIGLFGQELPKTVGNFYTIATTGIDGKTYANVPFHRVIKKFMIQGGDIVNHDGSGSISKYGETFPDEGFPVQHRGPGYVSMANSGPNTNGCQFFITTVATPWLNSKHVVFGKVVTGQDVVHKVELVRTDSNDRPLDEVFILKSGSVPTPQPFSIDSKQYDYQFLALGEGGVHTANIFRGNSWILSVDNAPVKSLIDLTELAFGLHAENRR